jgi:hypothetical protein
MNMTDKLATVSGFGTAVAVPAVSVDGSDFAGVIPVAAPVLTTSTELVEVVAPASLPGGYELHCDFRGRSVVVQVVRNFRLASSRRY